MNEALASVADDLAKPAEAIDDCVPIQDATWHESLGHTERCSFHLARALISNPELLLLEKPFSYYGQDMAEALCSALRGHVDNRGLYLPPIDPVELALKRRPRSIFFSTTDLSAEQEKLADLEWLLHAPGQINNGKNPLYEVPWQSKDTAVSLVVKSAPRERK